MCVVVWTFEKGKQKTNQEGIFLKSSLIFKKKNNDWKLLTSSQQIIFSTKIRIRERERGKERDGKVIVLKPTLLNQQVITKVWSVISSNTKSINHFHLIFLFFSVFPFFLSSSSLILRMNVFLFIESLGFLFKYQFSCEFPWHDVLPLNQCNDKE